MLTVSLVVLLCIVVSNLIRKNILKNSQKKLGSLERFELKRIFGKRLGMSHKAMTYHLL